MSSDPGAGGGGLPPGLDEESLRRLAEEMYRLPIRDLLVQTVGTIAQLSWGRISGPHKDLDQARLAIDALRALVPVVAPTVSEQAGRDLNAVVSSLQLAYVKALGGQGERVPAEAPAAAPEPGEGPADAPEPSAAPDPGAEPEPSAEA